MLVLAVVGQSTSKGNMAAKTRGQVPRKTEQQASEDIGHLSCESPQLLVNCTGFKFPYRESYASEVMIRSQLPSHRANIF